MHILCTISLDNKKLIISYILLYRFIMSGNQKVFLILFYIFYSLVNISHGIINKYYTLLPNNK